ncbi:helix-turn-helix domain-containing protein [Staphylococcus pasteuri]|uniref:helix-turn-helix domain-containing protein n=1 Tax=Staphylococcus pasteuri TaxID=45972 RepID=UPI002DBC0A84|nr:helix-turn-helix transcriptional regulator [Staphylococcus pasteuri]MEB7435544.1 helix-turn-helix domain-containing protein [Staphylococcus pasteuri]
MNLEHDYEAELLCQYIASELKQLRKMRKILVDDVAFDLGMSNSYVSNIENNHKPKLSLYMYIMLANYYDVPFEDIVKNARMKKEIDDKFR